MTRREIDSPQNPLIKSVAKLRSSRARREQGRFLIDGRRELGLAAQAEFDVEYAFIVRGTKEGVPEALRRTGKTQLFELSERAFAKLAYGDRQEVIAVAKTPSRGLSQIQLSEAPCIGVLDQIEKPGNIGAVLRTADGAGLDAVVVVDGPTDLFNPNIIRASLGTIFSMQAVSTTFEAYQGWARKHQLGHLLARCDAATDYAEVAYRSPCAIVMGSEAVGLASRWDTLPGEAIRLPMLGAADSLNVSATAAVLFYEYRRHRRQIAQTGPNGLPSH